MSESGRYYIKDEATGRRFWVEPMGERPTEKVFKNGGVGGDAEKNKSTPKGGSVTSAQSALTPENGFFEEDIVVIGPHMSPEGFIDWVVKNGYKLGDPEVKKDVTSNRKKIRELLPEEELPE